MSSRTYIKTWSSTFCILGAFVLLLILLFPPFRMDRAEGIKTFISHQFIFAPIDDDWATIDVTIWLAQALLVLLITGLLVLAELFRQRDRLTTVALGNGGIVNPPMKHHAPQTCAGTKLGPTINTSSTTGWLTQTSSERKVKPISGEDTESRPCGTAVFRKMAEKASPEIREEMLKSL